MKLRAWFSFAACGAGLLLSGCGGSAPASPAPVAPAVSALAGNWLIAGPMPTNGFNESPGFRLALTFDVTGNNVTASGFGSNSCSNAESSFGFGSLATGTIAADGSFSLQTPSSFPDLAMSIQGNVPKVTGSPWVGSYTVSLAPPRVPVTCDTNVTGTFTATPFPLVSGVYAGTGTTSAIVNGVLTTSPIAFQVTLHQGGTVTNPVTGTSLSSNSALSGSIRVQGSPCFTSGVTGVMPPSEVEGNQVVANFMMDDGSTLSILGSITDATETRIMTHVATVIGGQCGTVPSIYQLPELDLQS